MNMDLSTFPSQMKFEISKDNLVLLAKILLQEAQPIENEVIPVNDFLDFEEMCDFLGIAKATGYAKTSKNIIPHFKKGRKLYFSKSELIKWIELGRTSTQDDLDEIAENYLNKSKRIG